MKSIEKNFSELIKDWNNIYQWTKCKIFSYTEEISELLLKEFDQIEWSKNGLRSEKFKQVSHIGHCKRGIS